MYARRGLPDPRERAGAGGATLPRMGGMPPVEPPQRMGMGRPGMGMAQANQRFYQKDPYADLDGYEDDENEEYLVDDEEAYEGEEGDDEEMEINEMIEALNQDRIIEVIQGGGRVYEDEDMSPELIMFLAQNIGIDLENYPELVRIAEDAAKETVPKGFELRRYEENGDIYYEKASDTYYTMHPFHQTYIDQYNVEKAKIDRERAKGAAKPGQKPPQSKVPPLKNEEVRRFEEPPPPGGLKRRANKLGAAIEEAKNFDRTNFRTPYSPETKTSAVENKRNQNDNERKQPVPPKNRVDSTISSISNDDDLKPVLPSQDSSDFSHNIDSRRRKAPEPNMNKIGQEEMSSKASKSISSHQNSQNLNKSPSSLTNQSNNARKQMIIEPFVQESEESKEALEAQLQKEKSLRHIEQKKPEINAKGRNKTNSEVLNAREFEKRQFNERSSEKGSSIEIKGDSKKNSNPKESSHSIHSESSSIQPLEPPKTQGKHGLRKHLELQRQIEESQMNNRSPDQEKPQIPKNNEKKQGDQANSNKNLKEAHSPLEKPPSEGKMANFRNSPENLRPSINNSLSNNLSNTTFAEKPSKFKSAGLNETSDFGIGGSGSGSLKMTSNPNFLETNLPLAQSQKVMVHEIIREIIREVPASKDKGDSDEDSDQEEPKIKMDENQIEAIFVKISELAKGEKQKNEEREEERKKRFEVLDRALKEIQEERIKTQEMNKEIMDQIQKQMENMAMRNQIEKENEASKPLEEMKERLLALERENKELNGSLKKAMEEMEERITIESEKKEEKVEKESSSVKVVEELLKSNQEILKILAIKAVEGQNEQKSRMKEVKEKKEEGETLEEAPSEEEQLKPKMKGDASLNRSKRKEEKNSVKLEEFVKKWVELVSNEKIAIFHLESKGEIEKQVLKMVGDHYDNQSLSGLQVYFFLLPLLTSICVFLLIFNFESNRPDEELKELNQKIRSLNEFLSVVKRKSRIISEMGQELKNLDDSTNLVILDYLLQGKLELYKTMKVPELAQTDGIDSLPLREHQIGSVQTAQIVPKPEESLVRTKGEIQQNVENEGKKTGASFFTRTYEDGFYGNNSRTWQNRPRSSASFYKQVSFQGLASVRNQMKMASAATLRMSRPIGLGGSKPRASDILKLKGDLASIESGFSSMKTDISLRLQFKKQF